MLKRTIIYIIPSTTTTTAAAGSRRRSLLSNSKLSAFFAGSLPLRLEIKSKRGLGYTRVKGSMAPLHHVLVYGLYKPCLLTLPFGGLFFLTNISCLELWILSESMSMYFLLKNGDIPASYVSLPEGKGLPVTSWGLPSSPLTSYGFQNSSRLREGVNHLNRLDTLDYLGYLAVGVVGGLLLLRLFCERLLIWLRTFLFQDGCCHWMRMHVFMESWKKRWKKNTSFLLGMQFEAEKNAIGKNTVGAAHLAKHHFCKGGLSWFALAFGQLPFALEQYIMVPKAWFIQLLQFQQIPSPKETWQRVSNMPIQVVSDFRQSPKLSISLPTCVGPCTLHTVTIPRSM